ncbi:hypothetical protein B9Z19DRAFT_653564 [Tuber borchii]|uniref:Uncharacterized protein n=1 Tax=Tuber borchii TaxID=42251 RepID=A0A2T7A077_TUBBO|nr:hypothetical protein B9Z19DRAFT_653564 [Tuber borchii]
MWMLGVRYWGAAGKREISMVCSPTFPITDMHHGLSLMVQIDSTLASIQLSPEYHLSCTGLPLAPLKVGDLEKSGVMRVLLCDAKHTGKGILYCTWNSAQFYRAHRSEWPSVPGRQGQRGVRPGAGGRLVLASDCWWILSPLKFGDLHPTRTYHPCSQRDHVFLSQTQDAKLSS